MICMNIFMHSLSLFKNKAIALRKKGRTYSEILTVIPVAKSTLSEWLKEVGLAKPQVQRITALRIAGQKRAATRKREIRQKIQAEIYAESSAEIDHISIRELWLIGIALYWAEGSKQKEYAPSEGVTFSNSDPMMIRLFIQWLVRCIGIAENRISFEIYIHENAKNALTDVVRFWSKQTGFSKSCFNKIYFKKNKINSRRKNTGDLYYGLLRVTISTSTAFNRRITGWILGITKNCGIV